MLAKLNTFAPVGIDAIPVEAEVDVSTGLPKNRYRRHNYASIDGKGNAMTEAEWVACADPLPMLAFLRDRASERKLRLLAVAACREIWKRISEQRSRQSVEVAERFADGLVGDAELLRACHAAYDVSTRAQLGDVAAASAASAAASSSHPEIRRRIAGDGGAVAMSLHRAKAKRRAQMCRLVRCLFGTFHFRPLGINSVCLTPTVNVLAWTIYNDRAFDNLPILADALEEAGCADADILSHCRGDGPHARGCWVVDLILGKR
jgi:hypothetical protein